MGEYITINGEITKLGTCEDLYYIRLDQLRAVLPFAGALDGNLPPADYLKPEIWRYRFPFPDEDDVKPGSFEPYNRAVEIWLTNETAPGLLAYLQTGWEHEKLTMQTPHVNILGIPCPNSAEFVNSGLRLSAGGISRKVVELTQQKLMSTGEVWAVVRCPYCQAAVRLDPEGGAELAAACDAMPNKAYHEIARRIRAGYNLAEPAHCANCGNLLEPDEGHPSKIYNGPICDGCYDLEK